MHVRYSIIIRECNVRIVSFNVPAAFMHPPSLPCTSLRERIALYTSSRKADLCSAHWCLVALGLQDRSVHRVVHATQAVMHIMHAVLAALASSSDQQKPVPQATSCGKQEAALAYKWPKQNTANQERLPYRTKQYRHTSCEAKQMNAQ